MAKKKDKKKKVPQITFEQQMQSVVRINESVILEQEGDNYLKLKIKLKLGWFAKFMNILYKVRDYRRYLLTDFNRTLYLLIREKPRTVRELVIWLADREKLSFLEARSLILQFAAVQIQRALIVVEVPPPPEEDEDGHPITEEK